MKRTLLCIAGWLAGCAGAGTKTVAPGDTDTAEESVDSGDPSAGSCAPVELAVVQQWTKDDLPNRNTFEQRRPGVAVGDLDGDGDLDVMMAYGGGSMGLQNDGTGQLVESSAFTVDGGEIPEGSAVALADLDGDGDLDAYLGRQWETADQILWNDGSGRFTSTPLPGSEAGPSTGVFGDLDGDGDLDLVVGRLQESPQPDDIVAGLEQGEGLDLYLNESGNFTLANDRLPGFLDTAMVWEAELVDTDLDGDLDIYMANDFGPWLVPNQLLLNDGAATFTPAADCFCDLAMYAMGTAVGDVNNDLQPDLYITDIGGPTLLLSDGTGAFYDATFASGASIPPETTRMSSWGTQFADIDHDADLDLLVMFGRLGQHSEFVQETVDESWDDGAEQHDAILLGDTDGTFALADDLGFTDAERGRTVTLADLTGDGRPEVLTAGKHFLKVWSVSGGCDHGLSVTLEDPTHAPHGIGARVTVTVDGQRTSQWMLPGSTGSSNPMTLYFGLGEHTEADQVEVAWLDGRTTTLSSVAAGEALVLGPDGRL